MDFNSTPDRDNAYGNCRIREALERSLDEAERWLEMQMKSAPA